MRFYKSTLSYLSRYSSYGRSLKFISCAAFSATSVMATTAYVILNDSSDSDEKQSSDLSWKDRLLEKLMDQEQVQIKPEPANTNESNLINTLQRKEEYRMPKNPIILCHGLSGFDRIMVLPSLDLIVRLLKGQVKPDDFISLDDSHNGSISLEYWFGIQEELKARGCEVFVAKVPGFGSIEERAARLDVFINKQVERIREEKSKAEVYNDKGEQDQRSLKETGERLKVNLIAHSMGGLDGRYLIDKYNKHSNYEVVSLTTITTPHKGSEMADFVVNLVSQAPLLPSTFRLPTCLYQLTTSHMKEFNKLIKDSPDVNYFSYGASFQPQFYNVFYATWNIIADKAGDNDGMVSVESAKYGTYLGTLVDCDHLDLINWTGLVKRSMVKWTAKKLSEESVEGGEIHECAKGIDTVALYLDIADNLASRGL